MWYMNSQDSRSAAKIVIMKKIEVGKNKMKEN